MANVQSDVLNQLAFKYAQEGGEYTLYEIFELMRPVIKREVERFAKGTLIEPAEFEGVFYDSIMQALDGYNGQSPFLQRFRFFRYRQAIDTIRRHKKRTKMGTPIPITTLLDDTPDAEKEGCVIIPFDEDVAQNYQDKEAEREIKEMLVEFAKTHEQYSKIIDCLWNNQTTKEIANTVGRQTYDDTVRQWVRRSKKQFSVYLNEYRAKSAA